MGDFVDEAYLKEALAGAASWSPDIPGSRADG